MQRSCKTGAHTAGNPPALAKGEGALAGMLQATSSLSQAGRSSLVRAAMQGACPRSQRAQMLIHIKLFWQQ